MCITLNGALTSSTGVSPREEGSGTRYCVVTAYRNPGAVSQSRWITEDFARKETRGLENGLKGLW